MKRPSNNPMAPDCALDETGLSSQRERYRACGQDARLVDRRPRRLVVDVGEHVEEGLVRELIAVEQRCCPFFDLRWEPSARRLTVSVSREEHEPALDAIAFALELERSTRHASPS